MRGLLNIACAALLFLQAAAVHADPARMRPERALRVLNWSEYIDPGVVKSFEKKSGAKVLLTLYESTEEMLDAVKANPGGFDLMVISSYIISPLIKSGELAPFDRRRLMNDEHIEDKFDNCGLPGRDTYAIPYLYGPVGIGYRKDLVSKPVDSWRVIFEAPNAVGTFALLDAKREMIGSALRYAGRSANTGRAEDLAEAERLLLHARQRAAATAPTVPVRDLLIQGRVAVGVLFMGDLTAGLDEQPLLGFSIPQEGAITVVDCFTLSKTARHVSLAYAFLDHIHDPKNAAAVADYTRYPIANRSAVRYFNKKSESMRIAVQMAEAFEILEPLRDVDAAGAQFDEVWKRFMSK
jgi:spermidine/putrescine transport system substrate-binding protein